jgi:dihydrofolate reductase
VTLDGFIADPDGDAGFLPWEGDHGPAITAEYPETLPGHVADAIGMAIEPRHFDTLLCGRGFYDVALREGHPDPYPHLRTYVFSRTRGPSPEPNVTVVADDPAATARELKAGEGMGIWLGGGGTLAGALRDEIDVLLIKRYPYVLGAGISLFQGSPVPQRFEPVERRVFEDGVELTTYRR